MSLRDGRNIKQRDTMKTQTTGQCVEELVKRYGNYCSGLYILEQALLEATKGKRLSIDGNPSFYSTEGYKQIAERDKKLAVEWWRS